MVRLQPRDPRTFATAADLRDWLDVNHETAGELWVHLRRKPTGIPSVKWAEIVDEALCVGWIDSVRMPYDETGAAQRLTPRRKGSAWSPRNVGRAEALIAEGRMRPAGLVVFEARSVEATARMAESWANAALGPEDLAVLEADPAAWAAWQRKTASFQRAMARWVLDAKRPETRERRLRQLVADLVAPPGYRER